MRAFKYAVPLLTGLCVAAQAGYTHAQKPAPPQKPVYDQYEPSQVRRTRSQECLRDEEASGAYCIKVCQKGYLPVPNSDPPRCRSVEPLPPGSLPSPVRKETGTQPMPPQPPGPQQPRKPTGEY